jgi:uncharacterized protein (DUF1800 family)
MYSSIISSACFSPKLQWLNAEVNNIPRDINWVFNTIPKYMPLIENQPKVLFPEELEEEKRIIKQQEREAYLYAWMNAMVESDNPLREKMALFWHHHIPCTGGKNTDHTKLLLEILRKHGLGNLRDLLVELISTPALMRYLDLQGSSKISPNENFAREFLELYTLGEGNYSLLDVKETARAFTGRRYDKKQFPYTFFMDLDAFDDGQKTILGKRDNFNGEGVIDLVLEKKQTAIYITTSLLKFLVSDHPSQEMIHDCSEIYFSSNYNMLTLLNAVFSHNAFGNPKNKYNKIKTPVELLVSFQRQTGLRTVGLKTSYFFLRYTGQELFNPPNAAGWPGGKDWFRGERLLHRLYLPGTLMEIANRKFAKRSLTYKLQSRISLPNKRQYRYYADAIWSEELFYKLLKNNNLSVSEWLLGANNHEKNLSMTIQNLAFQYI